MFLVKITMYIDKTVLYTKGARGACKTEEEGLQDRKRELTRQKEMACKTEGVGLRASFSDAVKK